jgi:hypothetical protein
MIEKRFCVVYLNEASSVKSAFISASNEIKARSIVYNQIEDCVITLSATCID